MNAHEPLGGTTDGDGAEVASNSLVAFLRAIRFSGKSSAKNEAPRRRFAGLSSSRKNLPQDEDDCIRSGN